MPFVKEVHNQTEADLEARIATALAVAFPGIDPASIWHQHRFTIRLGHTVAEVDGRATDKVIGRLDVVLVRDGKPLAVLEVKRPGLELTDRDRAQGLSYARQMEHVYRGFRSTLIKHAFVDVGLLPKSVLNRSNGPGA
jgi:type I site-specific restriction endonuclease